MKAISLAGFVALLCFCPAAHSQIILEAQAIEVDSLDAIPGALQSFGIGGDGQMIGGDSIRAIPGMLSSIGLGGGKQLPQDISKLLRLPQIKEELGLQDDQLEAISKLSNVMREQISEVFKNVNFADGNASKIIQEAQRAIRAKALEKIEEVLTPRQLERLNQIKVQSSLQNAGAMSVLSGELGDAIALSDKQKGHLKKLHAKKQAELDQEIAALREKYREETLSVVLTEKQIKQLKELSGEPYEMKKPNFRSMFMNSLPANLKSKIQTEPKKD